MITESGLKVFARNINIPYGLGYTPFKFEYSELKLTIPRAKSQLIRYYLNGFIQIIYVFYSLSKLLTVFLNRHHLRLKYSHMFWLTCFTLSEIWGVGNFLSVKRTIREMHGFVNALVIHALRLSNDRKFAQRNGGRHLDFLQFIFQFYFLASSSCIVCLIGMFLLDTTQPQFMYSVAFPKGDIVFPHVVLFCGFEFYTKAGLTSVISNECIGILTMYVLGTSWAMNKLQNRKGLLTQLEKLRHYRALQVLNKMQIDGAGLLIPLMFVIFGLVWMMGVIGVIRLNNVVETVDYIILCFTAYAGGIVLLGIIHFSGNIPKNGRMVLANLKGTYDENSTKFQRKFLWKMSKSLQLFGIKSQPIRLIKHNAIYLYFGALINCIVTILVVNHK